MSRWKRRRARLIVFKPTPHEFAAALRDNEEHMGEHAAMMVTCEQFGIGEDEGYDLLIASADDQQEPAS